MEFQPKNSTTARKPGNDMKKNASVAKMGDSPAAWQKADKGLGFNGQDNTAKRPSNNGRYAGNQHSGFSNPDMIQETQMPVKRGYHGAKTAGPATAAGAGVTGRRDWAPSAGQNFRGNPDKIQDRQMPNRKGNMC
jgi:hypothetical protein